MEEKNKRSYGATIGIAVVLIVVKMFLFSMRKNRNKDSETYIPRSSYNQPYFTPDSSNIYKEFNSTIFRNELKEGTIQSLLYEPNGALFKRLNEFDQLIGKMKNDSTLFIKDGREKIIKSERKEIKQLFSYLDTLLVKYSFDELQITEFKNDIADRYIEELKKILYRN